MDDVKDTYNTLSKKSQEVLFKDKNSKFFGYAFPVETEEEIKEHLDSLRKNHHAARHWCYAWQIGKIEHSYRVNDDGEPSNSAGMPIYGQIQSFDLTNVLIVVVRYFGGVKLGVGGLIHAYRGAAQLALENSHIVTRTVDITFEIRFEYPEMNKVMRVIKERNLKVLNQVLELSCTIFISVRKKEAATIYEIFDGIYKVGIREIDQ